MWKVKKIISSIVSSVFIGTCVMVNSNLINADTNFHEFAMGAVKENNNYKNNELYVNVKSNSTLNNSTLTLPNKVDLSNTIYFPEIGDQGRIGSCSAFATTYYQYSYEVNKLNKIKDINERITYSPAFTYGLLSDGDISNGISITSAYESLANFGCLQYDDLPYDKNYFVDYPGEMESEKLEALKTRITSYGSYDISSTGTIITKNTDPDLNQVKNALYNGKMLVITTPYSWDVKKGYGNYSNKEIFYRAKAQNIGHAMAVVGYDDNICCDVNGNGKIEESEKGAFKLANSWGNDYGDNGYIWVLYDALNMVSANTTNTWESRLDGNRTSAFKFSFEENTFFYINVNHKDLNYIGEINFNTLDRCNLKIGYNRTDKTIKKASTYYDLFPFNFNIINHTPFKGVILFDYDDLCYPIANYTTGYNWHAYVSDASCRFRILDNLHNVLADYEKEGSEQSKINYKFKAINFKLGDANLDGTVDVFDAIYVSKYTTNNVQLSNVQLALADYNKDGQVDVFDANAIAKLTVQ